jgi:hypothetical protein
MTDPWESYWPAVWSDDMKNVRGLGPFYFVLHKQRIDKRVHKAHAREIDPPYRWGVGIEVNLLRGWVVQVGVCRRRKFEHEYDAIQAALGARDLGEIDGADLDDDGTHFHLHAESGQ